MDWNLVSTASTAINAWLNPIDQLTMSIVGLLRGYGKRSAGLLASMMADALDIQTIHHPCRVRFFPNLTVGYEYNLVCSVLICAEQV